MKIEREKFFEQLKNELDTLNEQLAGLEKGADKIKSAFKKDFSEKTSEFKKNSEEVKDILQDLAKVGERSLKSFVDSVEGVWKEMEDTLVESTKDASDDSSSEDNK